MKKLLFAILFCLALLPTTANAADRHIREVWGEMGFPQSEITYHNSILHLEHDSQKVDIPIIKSEGVSYTVNGYEDKFQEKVCLKGGKIYASDTEIKKLFGFWESEPARPEIVGSDEFKKQINFYLNYMRIHLPYFYNFVCDNLTIITEKLDMGSVTGAFIYKDDTSGKAYMKLENPAKMIYAGLIHEAKHVYDFKNTPNISMYDLESNAYKLSYMALENIGFDEEFINSYIHDVNIFVLYFLKYQ